MRLFKGILIGFVVLVAIIVAAVYIYLNNQSPKYSGELNLSGIEKPVEVIFDKYGIPHIYAQNQKDAYYALGYVQAQDRLFQMTLYKRLVNGRASEIFGADLIPTDKYFLNLGLNKVSQEAAKRHFNTGEKAAFQEPIIAYLQGINAFIAEDCLPVEFDLIGFKPDKFTIEDVYGSISLTALGFSFAQREDLILNYIYHDLGVEYFTDFSKDFIVDTDSTQAAISLIMGENLDKAMQSLQLPLWEGSNGWVVAPQKTKSGKALLANDTHIGFAQPSVWYEAYINYPGYEFYGSYLPTCPYGVLGHNRDLAWGLTIFPFDNMDYYQIQDYGDSTTYLYSGDTLDYQIEEMEIAVKNADPVLFTRKNTVLGPLVNQTDPFIDSLYQNNIALAWSIYHLPHTSLQALYQLNNAHNMDEFKASLPLIDIVGLNVMYADKDDNIAWWGCGKIPIRDSLSQTYLFLQSNKNTDGLFGFQPFSENPQLENPESGFIATANNNPVLSGSHFERGNYLPSDRVLRIQKMLNQKNDWNIYNTKDLQLDAISDAKSDITIFITEHLIDIPEEEKYSEAFEILKQWDGKCDLQSVAPTIFARFYFHIAQLTVSDELGPVLFDKMQGSYLLKKNLPTIIYNEKSPWWKNKSMDKINTRDEILTLAFMKTIDELVQEMGEDLQEWKWGKVHLVTHGHPIGKKKPMDKVFNVGPYSIAGGNQVINKMAFRISGDAIHQVSSGPALRVILDFENIDEGVNVIPTGQSGNIFSPYYSDQAEMYVKGEYRLMIMDKETLLNMDHQTLKINPQ